MTVDRKGYNGPITLTSPTRPPGLTVRPGTIAAGQVVGVFTVSAAADAAFGARRLEVVGQGQGPDGPIVVPARSRRLRPAGTVLTDHVTQTQTAWPPRRRCRRP